MALINCSECNKKISDSAKNCPSCGAPVPKEKSLMPRIILIAIIIGVTWSAFTKNDEKKLTAISFSESESNTDQDKCKTDDITCIANKGVAKATGQCKRQIEKLSVNEYKWENSLLKPIFSKVQWFDQDHGTITYIGDKIKFQNDSNAFVNMIYQCDVLITGNVIGVRAKPGKL